MEKCTNEQAKQLTPSAIKYLMATAQLCSAGEGARCVDVAARLNVSKAKRRPSCAKRAMHRCTSGCMRRWRLTRSFAAALR